MPCVPNNLFVSRAVGSAKAGRRATKVDPIVALRAE
jgi:hypothetical protein